MNRLLTILFLFINAALFAQKKDYQVMDWKTESTLNTYLVQQMLGQYDERMISFEQALSSRTSLRAYIDTVRRKYLDLLGSFPAKTPLNADVTSTIRTKQYRIEKIVYESFANHHVTANLYLPAGNGPFPAAIMFCGHEDASKATESYQRTALLFVKEGFAVMVIDPISQSERHQLTDANGKPLTRGGTTEHTLINASSNLVGTSAAAYELWDNVRGLDYLVSRPDIDADRIGCIGNSGGAIQAIYLAAFDPRVKVIVPCSYLASRERTLELSGPADGCAQIPGEGKLQLEMVDYLIAAAPKPVLVLAGRYDFIDYNSTLFAFNDLKRAYDVLGEPGKAQIFVYDDGHGISKPKREAAVGWFKRWLAKDVPIAREDSVGVYKDKELFATKAGQVNKEYANEVSVFKRNLLLADSLEASRRAFLEHPVSEVKKKISNLLELGYDFQSGALSNNTEGILIKDGISFYKMIIRQEGQTPLPVLMALTSKHKKIVAWFHDGGKHVIADSIELVKSYLDQGAVVILCYVRGTGETADKPELNDPKYFNREYRNAMLALHTGRSLVIQRASDILLALSGVTFAADTRLPLEIHASGPVALSALHAATVNDRISRLYLYNCITSFKQILENPAARDWYSYVIPGVLKYYDIPDLVKLVGEKRVVFVNDQTTK
jgi:cephalosporin-C deacetylase-like acetyl esterase